MGAATAVGRQFTETDFPGAFAQRCQARQVMGDPLFNAELDGPGINFLCRIRRFELHTSFARPVMQP